MVVAAKSTAPLYGDAVRVHAWVSLPIPPQPNPLKSCWSEICSQDSGIFPLVGDERQARQPATFPELTGYACCHSRQRMYGRTVA